MADRFRSLGVVGAGAGGTALAQTARRAGRDVALWAFEPETADAINSEHENTAFLPGIKLDSGVRATTRLADMAACDMLLLVTPAQHTRRVTAELARLMPDERPLLICAKGIEQATRKLLSDVVAETLPQAVPAVLSGPSFADEVARGLPAALTLACEDEALGQDIARCIGHRTFRPYWSPDLIGAQIGGAIKNVLAIAAGIVVGRKLGANAHAALVTRGFYEMAQVGEALGARFETLSGLSGLGDLVLTCGSPRSRNMSLGVALGEGKTLDEVLGARRSVSEGVFTASAVMRIAGEHGLDLPICAAVDAVVSGTRGVDDAIEGLLARPIRAEM
ncbi:MAG: NAD(P)H-dependent glycerol-3-phosphate dehydrogenase [Pseudomonadota bacterium]|nr:NAD(P)H-dependent glycerol-3-phosphate dehydrogenase [Pseudomonadota bacterium]